VPPLRDRKEDIEDLAQLLLFKLCKKHGRNPIRLTQDQVQHLKQLPWRGNIRELHNTLERALIFSLDGEPLALKKIDSLSLNHEPISQIKIGGPFTLEEIEKAHIEATLNRLESVEEVAQVLGINPSTLWRKRKVYEQASKGEVPSVSSAPENQGNSNQNNLLN
jgi:NtrC-family two-component system response regulator AlgB